MTPNSKQSLTYNFPRSEWKKFSHVRAFPVDINVSLQNITYILHYVFVVYSSDLSVLHWKVQWIGSMQCTKFSTAKLKFNGHTLLFFHTNFPTFGILSIRWRCSKEAQVKQQNSALNRKLYPTLQNRACIYLAQNDSSMVCTDEEPNASFNKNQNWQAYYCITLIKLNNLNVRKKHKTLTLVSIKTLSTNNSEINGEKNLEFNIIKNEIRRKHKESKLP